MPSVADLVSLDRLEALATASNRELGRRIVTEGGVELLEFGPLAVRARVGGTPSAGQRRTVELRSGPEGLTWSCTCTKGDLFCKHCAAAALLVWEKAPARQG